MKRRCVLPLETRATTTRWQGQHAGAAAAPPARPIRNHPLPGQQPPCQPPARKTAAVPATTRAWETLTPPLPTPAWWATAPPQQLVPKLAMAHLQRGSVLLTAVAAASLAAAQAAKPPGRLLRQATQVAFAAVMRAPLGLHRLLVLPPLQQRSAQDCRLTMPMGQTAAAAAAHLRSCWCWRSWPQPSPTTGSTRCPRREARALRHVHQLSRHHALRP